MSAAAVMAAMTMNMAMIPPATDATSGAALGARGLPHDKCAPHNAAFLAETSTDPGYTAALQPRSRRSSQRRIMDEYCDHGDREGKVT